METNPDKVNNLKSFLCLKDETSVTRITSGWFNDRLPKF